jgi:large subunit ribosomal protein L10
MDNKKISQAKGIKIEAVGVLKEKITKAKALFITEYRGLTHVQLETLRKGLKKVDAELVVAKNTLMRIAMKEWNSEMVEKLKDAFQNPTATLFIYGDEVAPIKELAKFIKSVQMPKVKMGIFNGTVATEADFGKLATLPTRDVLLATLVNRLESPIYGLHHALSWNLQQFVTVLENIKSKKK